MSIWIYTLYVTAILTVSQAPQGPRKRCARLKSQSSFQNVKNVLGYLGNVREHVYQGRNPQREAPPEDTALPEPGIFIELLNNLSIMEYHKNAIIQWNFESNITSSTRKLALNASVRLAQFQRSVWKAAMRYDWRNLKNCEQMRRQFEMLSVLGIAVLPDDKFAKLDEIINSMESIYSTATVFPYDNSKTVTEIKNCSSKSKKTRRKTEQGRLRLEPDLLKIMAESKDPDELLYIWKAWRDATGKKMKQQYITYVQLMKEVAKLNNFTSVRKYWTHAYEDPNFETTVSNLWKEVKPLYLELHAYVRGKLREKYGSDMIQESGYLPAHLLGDMWSQSWIHLYNDTIPYPMSASPDLTKALIENNFTTIEFFKLAEDFFHSMGFPFLPDSFWNRSILERPKDKRELVCHGSAWDMYDGKDFRIKMCTHVTYDDLVIVHHEMGHVQYYMQYKNQPILFREGANPGFHEAVGDTIALSVSSPPHTCGIGLTDNESYDAKSDINFLFMMALQKVAFIPFAYCVDKWRWAVFGKDVTPEQYNNLWWEFRGEIQGVEAPVDRGKDDFDPGAKYHIAANVPYIRYFVSFIIQFQFFEAMCLSSGQYDPGDPHRPLHRCDIYGSQEAGIALRQMMRLGASQPWPNAMEVLTGRKDMQTAGLLAYFRPLYRWLKDENTRNNESVGY